MSSSVCCMVYCQYMTVMVMYEMFDTRSWHWMLRIDAQVYNATAWTTMQSSLKFNYDKNVTQSKTKDTMA